MSLATFSPSLGIAVASGMIASTCIAVVFVPSFFVVLQRWQERKRGVKNVKVLGNHEQASGTSNGNVDENAF